MSEYVKRIEFVILIRLNQSKSFNLVLNVVEIYQRIERCSVIHANLTLSCQLCIEISKEWFLFFPPARSVKNHD